MTDPTDKDLLEASRRGDADAFAVLFERHGDLVLSYLMRRARDAEVAADLTAETFAAALLATRREQFTTPDTPAAWLLTIARNKLIDAHRRGRVQEQARRAAGMPRIAITDADLERISELTDEGRVLALLNSLPADQREAVRARVLDDLDYPEIARRIQTSELVARKRVSRGLRRLRLSLEARQ